MSKDDRLRLARIRAELICNPRRNTVELFTEDFNFMAKELDKVFHVEPRLNDPRNTLQNVRYQLVEVLGTLQRLSNQLLQEQIKEAHERTADTRKG